MGLQRILIIQTAFIGDVILATCLIEKLNAFFPEAEIDFVLRKGNEGLLKDHPILRAVLLFDKKNKRQSLLQLIRRIRARHYDLVVNAQRFFSSGLMAVTSGARQIVGFEKNPLAFGFTRRLPHQMGSGQHEVERDLSLIAHLTDDRLVRPRLYPTEADYAGIPRQERYICIAPTSVWFTKQYPPARWIAFLDALDEDMPAYLLGGPADRKACDHIRQQTKHPRVTNKAGELSLLASAAWMQHAAMNYANDSAPVHLATAVDAPIAEIYCSTVPAFGFTPLSSVSHVLQTDQELSCRPCGLHGHAACPEGHFKCAEISAEALLDVLSRK